MKPPMRPMTKFPQPPKFSKPPVNETVMKKAMRKIVKPLTYAVALGIGVTGINYAHDRAVNQIPQLQTFNYDPNWAFDMLTQERDELFGSARGITIPISDPESYKGLAERFAEKYENRDPFRHYDLEDILVGILTIESRGDRNADSKHPNYARGIMQIIPSTAEECGISRNVYHRILNMDCGTDLLIRNYNYLRPRVENKFGIYLSDNQLDELTEHFAITAYNNGMGNVGNAINRYDLGFFEGLNARAGPLDLQELVPRVIGAGNVRALGEESTEYFPRFLQVYEDVINRPFYTVDRIRWELN